MEPIVCSPERGGGSVGAAGAFMLAMWHVAPSLQSRMDALLRHIAACNSARLPGARLPFRLAGAVVGWVKPELAETLSGFPAVSLAGGEVLLADASALPAIVDALRERGVFRWRAEAFDVRATPEGPVLGRMDRGALPKFGVMAVGVHVNGLVLRPDGASLWVGQRAADKSLDPSKLDNIVAGGVPAGMTPEATLIKEAGEEAAIPPELAARAVRVGRIGYAMEREEGLRRDLLLCYDLTLPEAFAPHAADGEVARFELWPLARVLATVRAGDAFKFNVNLVLIDLFLRRGLIVGEEAARLRSALAAPAFGAPA
jgi:8-oxo-dGTP pyrophosphatase MutT (NUDIX family)